jgi:hypothetical protein
VITAKSATEGIRIAKTAALSSACLLALAMAGCGGSVLQSNTGSSETTEVQKYMSVPVSDDTNSLKTYTIDDGKSTFSQWTYNLSGTQEGPQLNYSGTFTTLDRGLRALDVIYSYGSSTNTVGWAIELDNQAGGLLDLSGSGRPFTPLVAANNCPSYSTAKTFQFVTIPAALTAGSDGSYTWNSQYDTAYGNVDISGSGTAIAFNNIKQFNAAGAQLTSYQALATTPSAISSATGSCSQTFYGNNTVSIPGYITITDPGANETVSPSALVGVGSTGLLVESNGDGADSTTMEFQPFLGAGTGAIGLPQPSSALDTSALTDAQYLGFIYSGGTYGAVRNTATSSTVASFGYSSVPSTCASIATQTSTMIYGGDFPNNDPSSSTVQSNGGYGNCDVAVDLGKQDSSHYGRFSAATVYLGSSYSANTTGKRYSFPATAIAGQLNGKYAIFLIAVDATTNQAWGIYLLQSN